MKRWLLRLSSAVTLFLAFGSSCWAWGILADYAGYPEGYLVKPLVETGHINYCIDVKDARYDAKTVDIEIRQALGLWLHFAQKQLSRVATITNVPCENRNLNLRVSFLPGVTPPEDAGHEYFTFENTGPYAGPNFRSYAVIEINTIYKYRISWFLSYDESDFAWFVENSKKLNHEDLSGYLKEISVIHPQATTSERVQKDLNKSYDSIHYSTYSTLIHEIGHAFGLCDMYQKGLSNCDPKTVPAVRPPSVMRDADYFYLTEDDAAGLRAVFTVPFRK